MSATSTRNKSIPASTCLKIEFTFATFSVAIVITKHHLLVTLSNKRLDLNLELIIDRSHILFF